MSIDCLTLTPMGKKNGPSQQLWRHQLGNFQRL